MKTLSVKNKRMARMWRTSNSWIYLLVLSVCTASFFQFPAFSQQQSAEPSGGLLGPLHWENPAPGESSRVVPRPADQLPNSNTDGVVGPMGWERHSENAQALSKSTVKAVDRYNLIGPFFWENPNSHSAVQRFTQNADQQSLPSTNRFGQDIGLMGPLHWQNAPGNLRQLPEPAQEPIYGDFSDQRWAQANPNAVNLMQGEELANPPEQASQSVVPIPADASDQAGSNPAIPPVPPLPESLGPGTPLGPSDVANSNSLEGAEKLGDEPPPTNRLQFLRASTVLLEPGEMQYDIGFSYQIAESDLTVVDSMSNLVEAEFKQRQLVMPLEIRFGLTRRAQFFIGAPFGWSQTDFSSFGFDERDNDGGVGDVTTGISFLVRDGQGRCTDTIFTVAGTFPSGGNPFADALLTTVAPALGQGFYGLSTDLLWIDTFDPVVVFYGLGWRHQFGRDYFAQHIQPGEELRGQLGVGFALNPNVTLSTRFNVSYFTDTRIDHMNFDGTFAEPMSLRFAATIANCGRLIEPFAEIGVTDDAPDGRFGITWTY